jgi:hypothetical protein
MMLPAPPKPRDDAVAESGIFRVAHGVWQRANVIAAAAYLREILAREPDNVRVKALYDGLLEVLDPTRRAVRLQRELASATTAAKRERRSRERRSGVDRRQRPLDGLGELERRSGADRRTGRDRRKRG